MAVACEVLPIAMPAYDAAVTSEPPPTAIPVKPALTAPAPRATSSPPVADALPPIAVPPPDVLALAPIAVLVAVPAAATDLWVESVVQLSTSVVAPVTPPELAAPVPRTVCALAPGAPMPIDSRSAATAAPPPLMRPTLRFFMPSTLQASRMIARMRERAP